ncbi:DUF808 domain-containing protein [Corynebacterium endometrii]|uniref:Inner membrane protein YedI n=1 Tax=Corynebacterium endometrii TaxID=2488819 RepID=A0A4P7QGQ6_9CORY|nr:DUF808 domain-containing protein [Corynebacterium endometrii]QCB28156.1 Inner membrane protein YedI [Corynebacterium endometrii]
MAGGLLALLDDVAVIARAAAASADDVVAMAGKTSMKAAGVVIDDAAVTPQYVTGVNPKRELPMIWKITKGSLRNKLLIILPIVLLLSWLAPWALTPILMCGGAYLCYEGAHKIWEKVVPHEKAHHDPVQERDANAEDKLVNSAITTDLILSAEIMVISLNEIIDQPFWTRLMVLIVVGIGITLAVYGAVAILVKMDDVGLRMIERRDGKASIGHLLVKGMPYVLSLIGIVGTAAMLWVGGHIIVAGLDEFGLSWPYETIHHWSESVPAGVVSWLVDTGASMVFGLIVGMIVLGVVSLVKPLFGKNKPKDAAH